MSETVIREKRQAPRVKQELPVRLIREDETDNLECNTKDLSCVGAKILLDHALPHNSLLEITLDLPSGPEIFHGIVVRSESVENNKYEVSLYFSDITMKSRGKINDFVKEKWM